MDLIDNPFSKKKKPIELKLGIKSKSMATTKGVAILRIKLKIAKE